MPPTIRVVVRLPWNRPENAEPDPPRIEWTPEKADILWKVIEKSRSSDSGGADWKGLAAHLQVPLPYLLYRVNARFQEDIRGLKDIQGALSPNPANTSNSKPEAQQTERPSLAVRTSINNARLSVSKLTTPRNVRARLNSLGNNSPRPKKTISSSTLTATAKRTHIHMRPTSPFSSEGSETDEEEALNEEEAARTAEEEHALDRKLEELQRMITNDTLGLVKGASKHRSRKSVDRGRNLNNISSPASMSGSYRNDSLSSRSDNQSLSSVSSPQGSIPEIPSPSTDSQSHSPMRGYLSPNKSTSSVALSPRSALGQGSRRNTQLVSEPGSSHESEASSFSDLSDASLSASALESGFMSSVRSTTTTRMSNHFTSRSRAQRPL